MKLGVIVFFGFLAALVLRPYLQRTAVLSVTRKFSLVAFTTAIIVTAVVIMVFARDIVWLARIDPEDDVTLVVVKLL